MQNTKTDEAQPEQSSFDQAGYMQQQIFLLEDTVMTMSMAVTTISRAVQRWEKLILPMMAAFILLAAYGFYLIYNLTADISKISRSVATMTQVVDVNMQQISRELTQVRGHMDGITDEMRAMRQDMSQMNQQMVQMNYHIAQMNANTGRMGADLGDLNRNISGPMGTMNNWVPWNMMGGRRANASSTQPPSTYPQPYYMPAPETTH